MPLLRAHLLCQRVIIASVWLGALLAPGAAFATSGRLAGVLWPMPPPQVAHYAAVLFGCTVILWFCGVVTGRGMALTLVGAGAALVATHTRTALLGVVLGLIVAGASLFVGYARVRRTGAVVVLASVAAWIVFSPLIVSWLARGQSEQDLTQLTGRTKVWSALAQQQFTTMQQLFGTGLGNKSFNGLPIDSNWVATRFELGRVGVAIVVAILLVLLLSCRHPASGAEAGHCALSSSSTALRHPSPRRDWATLRHICSTSRWPPPSWLARHGSPADGRSWTDTCGGAGSRNMRFGSERLAVLRRVQDRALSVFNELRFQWLRHRRQEYALICIHRRCR